MGARQQYPDSPKHKARCEYQKRYYRENEEYRNRARERAFASHLQRTYGLSVADFERMLAKCEGVCEICGGPPGRNRLDIDHCHISGKVRGLLCNVCNTRLAWLEDTEWVAKAQDYLRRYNTLH